MTNGDDEIAKEIIKSPAREWLNELYMTYALYVIQDRALIAEDGLKPVHRRILYSLFRDGITSTALHMKAARAAGNAVAFHPHGTNSIEEALARMAQPFSMRVPLVDPYGSVGFLTGDTPAAARYWECRLTKPAMELLRELPQGAVGMSSNFDGTESEPTLLPIRWPNDIINGSDGIAIGYASTMFPHNPGEVIDAARKMLKNPDMTAQQLLKVMPGPDFPTGGELLGVDGVEQYYRTGKGKFNIRGRYTIDKMPRGKVKITFYELPFKVSATDIIDTIRAAQQAGTGFQNIANVRDLSDRKNGLRLVIETKAGTNHLAVLNEVFKDTKAQNSFTANMTILSNNSPQVVSMVDLIKNFVEFRKLCNINKAQSRITHIDRRTHQLDALLAALLDIDHALSIIRQAESSDAAKTELKKAFSLDDEQADYILSMQLRRLTKADSVDINNEYTNLQQERQQLHELLTDSDKMTEHISQELRETKKVIHDPRRTVVSNVTVDEAQNEQKQQAKAAREENKNVPCYVTRLMNGRVLKTSEPFAYTGKPQQYEYGLIAEQVKMKSQDDIVLIGSDGMGRKVPLSYLPFDDITSASDMGVQLPHNVHLVGIAKNEPMKSDVGIAMGTHYGEVKVSKTDFPNRDEFPVFLLKEGDAIVNSLWVGRSLRTAHFAFGVSDSNVLLFEASSVRPSGSKAGGVKGVGVKEGEHVLSFALLEDIKDHSAVVVTRTDQSIKQTPVSFIPTKNKGGMGVATHLFRRGESTLVDCFIGVNPGFMMTQTSDVIAAPPVASKRSTSGTSMTISVSTGSTAVKSM